MTLAELIGKRLSEKREIAEELAVFAERPAVFYQTAPDDGHDGWGTGARYPRLVYFLDMQKNQEKQSVGILKVSLLREETGTGLAALEPLVRACMQNLIMQPEEGPGYCCSWSGTKSLTGTAGDSGNHPAVSGVDITFDLLEYPSQETTDPDPVAALNRYIKKRIPQAFVLGLDYIEYFQTADAKAPVFYCRMDSVEKGQVTNTVAWMDGKIAVHVLCPREDIRVKMVMDLANALSMEGEILMLDHSPMGIQGMKVNHRADYLKDGQILVTGHYGLLRYRSKPHRITESHIDLG